jgi:hypothetical protein
MHQNRDGLGARVLDFRNDLHSNFFGAQISGLAFGASFSREAGYN